MSLLIGLSAGIFGGLLGIGGGIVMIPLMVSLLKVSQHRAHGTSLAAMVFLGAVGAVTYGLKGSVDLMASALLASTAVITAYAGARHAHELPDWKLKRSFGLFLTIASTLMLLKPFLPHFAYLTTGWNRVIVLLAAGALSGFLSGMMGVGGAVVMIPAMVLFAGLDQHTAQGSSLLTMVPAGIVGVWSHKRLGNIETRLLSGLIPGVVIGTYLGGNIAHFLADGILRSVFGLMLLWTAFRFLRASAPGEARPDDTDA